MDHIIELRRSTKLTQKAFAERYGIPLSTLRKWEQGESTTPHYVIRYIQSTLPYKKSEYEKIIGKKGDAYFIDKENKRVGDAQGNWIPYKEDIEGVIKSNLSLYLDYLFEDYYEIIKKFDLDLYYDKKDKIIWE